MIDGVKVSLGGKEYNVPPLNFKALKRLKKEWDIIATPTTTLDAERISAIVELAFAAINRNYPTLQKDELEDIIDLKNSGKLLNALMGVSGFIEKKEISAP